MRTADRVESWWIREEPFHAGLDCALWFRAVERIDARPGGLVPGPLDISPVPIRTDALFDSTQLAAGWAWWWQALMDGLHGAARGSEPLSWPELAGLTPWPQLRGVVFDRWDEAQKWHDERKRSALRVERRSGPVPGSDHIATALVTGMEQRAGRASRPFELDVVIIPVLDDEVRRIDDTTYLVPERVRKGPGWQYTLFDLVQPLF